MQMRVNYNLLVLMTKKVFFQLIEKKAIHSIIVHLTHGRNLLALKLTKGNVRAREKVRRDVLNRRWVVQP